MSRKTISIVIPVLNEQGNVPLMYAALQDASAQVPQLDFEFLFVDDGSRDETYPMLVALNASDPRVKIVRLSRNFGSHIAAAAGLQHCTGDCAIIMAGDLQDHPREIPRFVEKWLEGFQVVMGIRARRQEPLAAQLMARLFAATIRRVALPNYPPGGTGSFCLIDRKVIDALNSFPERNRMTFGLILFSGFRQTSIYYERLSRQIGTSNWSFAHKLKHTIDTIVSFSFAPIRLALVAGAALSAVCLAYILYIAFSSVILGAAVPGWTTVVCLIGLLGGVQILILGILGEYLWRMMDDIRQRPLFILQDTLGDLRDVGQVSVRSAGASAHRGDH